MKKIFFLITFTLINTLPGQSADRDRDTLSNYGTLAASSKLVKENTQPPQEEENTATSSKYENIYKKYNFNLQEREYFVDTLKSDEFWDKVFAIVCCCWLCPTPEESRIKTAIDRTLEERAWNNRDRSQDYRYQDDYDWDFD